MAACHLGASAQSSPRCPAPPHWGFSADSRLEAPTRLSPPCADSVSDKAQSPGPQEPPPGGLTPLAPVPRPRGSSLPLQPGHGLGWAAGGGLGRGLGRLGSLCSPGSFSQPSPFQPSQSAGRGVPFPGCRTAGATRQAPPAEPVSCSGQGGGSARWVGGSPLFPRGRCPSPCWRGPLVRHDELWDCRPAGGALGSAGADRRLGAGSRTAVTRVDPRLGGSPAVLCRVGQGGRPALAGV